MDIFNFYLFFFLQNIIENLIFYQCDIFFLTGLGLGVGLGAGPGAIAVIGGGAGYGGLGGALGGGDAGVAVINGPSGAIHAGLGAHGAVIPAPIGKWA